MFVVTNVLAFPMMLAFVTVPRDLGWQESAIMNRLTDEFFGGAAINFHDAALYWYEQLLQTVFFDLPGLYGFHISTVTASPTHWISVTLVAIFKLVAIGGLIRLLGYTIDMKASAPTGP